MLIKGMHLWCRAHVTGLSPSRHHVSNAMLPPRTPSSYSPLPDHLLILYRMRNKET